MAKIGYFHGKNSDGVEKTNALQTLLPEHEVVNIPYDDTSYNTASPDLIKLECDLLIGTSLGGYMAMHVGFNNHIPAILLNPSFRPDIKNGDGWKVDADSVAGGQWILLQNIDDEYLDPTIAIEFASRHNRPVMMFSKGGHRFTNLHEVVNIVNATLNQVIP